MSSRIKTTLWRFIIAFIAAVLIVVGIFALMSLLYFKGGESGEPPDMPERDWIAE